MKLSDKELKHLTSLAKIKLANDELNKFQKQVSDILTFVDELKKMDVTGADKISQMSGEVNNWRLDKKYEASGKQKKRIHDAAPETKDGFLKVPGIFSDL